MTTVSRPAAAPQASRKALIDELKKHALVVEEVTLSSGAKAEYFIDAKRVILQPSGFWLLAEQIDHYVQELGATAVGGLTLGADAIACAALVNRTANVKGFFVRKEPKPHGLQKLIEGPPLEPGDRCLIVDDVVTSGASTIKAIKAIQGLHEHEIEICGVLAILDRLAGGAEDIEDAAGAPFVALTTIEDVYPARPDRKPA
ncbi:MAG TPA: phosphoribosyltransferase [Solirubrobacteraceae bacterium]|jgi:orotate phosphoribosyltransferase|nr:phosphoribosyltransferase [Solirubrobacteraceae bacterium]